MRSDKIETVGDLRELLRDLDDDTDLEIAITPDVNGWTTQLLFARHLNEHKDLVVLGAAEEAATPDERDLTFRDPDGNEVRPV